MNTKIIAHRGAWKEFYLPENSMAALQKAIELKCYGTEFDVHLTKDEVFVVHHDEAIQSLNIYEHRFDDLAELRLDNGERLPSLEDFLTFGLSQQHTKLFVELKSSPLGIQHTFRAVECLAELISKKNNTLIIEFILFSFEAAIYLKQLLPNHSIHYLNGDKTAAEINTVGLNGMDYFYEILLQEPEIITSFQNLNLMTNCWTVNDLNIAKQLSQLKIDAITTDFPMKLINGL